MLTARCSLRAQVLSAAIQAVASAGQLERGFELLRKLHTLPTHAEGSSLLPAHHMLLEGCRAAGAHGRAAEVSAPQAR